MFSTKVELDRHVKDIFNKLPSDVERDTKCYSIAKQYYRIKDFDSALKYVNRYINGVKSTAGAQKLLGECYEALNKPANALAAYKTSLELDGGQRDLVVKVCQILCNPDAPLVASQASYWLDRLQGLYPSHALVFKLKERLLQADGDGRKNPKELESLYLSEIMARPDDATVRIRFFDFLLATNRAKVAHDNATELLALGVFADHLPWYECLHRVFQAYEKIDNNLNMDFKLRKLNVLERQSYFNLQDCGEEKRCNSECELSLFNFDQALQAVSKIEVQKAERTFFESALAHFRYQLAYHLAIFKLKRAKSEAGEWQRAVKLANPLLMFATEPTVLKNQENNRFAARWQWQAAERIAVSSHVIMAQAQVKGDKFIPEIHESCSGKWRERAYEKLFYNREHLDAIKTSHFVNDPSFSVRLGSLPTEAELKRCDSEAQLAFPDTLHYMIWLGLANLTPSGTIKPSFRANMVSKLPLNSNVSAISQLDVDAFLYAAIFCSKSRPHTQYGSDCPPLLPASIAEQLGTQQQTEWWASMYRSVNNRPSPPGSNNCEIRLRLSKGIETIRACVSHGLHPALLVLLAKQFQLRATQANCDNQLKDALEDRAEMYWQAAIPLLEQVEQNKTIREVSSKLFDFNASDFKRDAAREALEDAKLFLACQLMKRAKYEEAIDSLQQVKSAFAPYYQAVMYKKLSEDCAVAERGALLTRAKHSLGLAKDRLRWQGAPQSHPLLELHQQLNDEVDEILARTNRSGDTSDMTISTPRILKDDVTEQWLLSEASPRTTPRPARETHSTPRSVRSELFPSPNPAPIPVPAPTPSVNDEVEKLTEQVKTLMASKEEVTLLRSDLGEVKNILGDLLSEFKKLSVKLAERPSAADELLSFPDADDYAEDAYASVLQQQANASNIQRVMQQTSIPYAQQLARETMNAFLPPGYMWNGGLPFDGQPMADLHAAAALIPPVAPVAPQPVPRSVPILPGVPDFFPKSVPNVVVTSSATLPVLPVTASPLMSVTIPAEHIRQPVKPVAAPEGIHAFQIQLPPGVAPTVIQSPSDQHEARMYSNQPAFNLNTTPTSKTPDATAVQKAATPAQPATSTTFKFGDLSVKSPVVSGIQKSPLLPTPVALNSSNDDSFGQAEYDPCPDFKPIVSLPEVEVRTGEEDETQLFQSNAILYVFRESGEWKERGRGVVKVLHDEKTDKVRVLMRRDQVHKVCANHHILPEMTLSPMKKSPNAFIWAAHDFSEETVASERFCIKFKTLDEAKDFEYAFNKGREITRDSPKKQTKESTPVVAPKAPPAAKANIFDAPKPFTFTPSATTPSNAVPKKDALMDENKPVFGFGSGAALDFTALAKSSGNAFKTTPEFKGFAGAGAPVFGAKPSVAASGDSSNKDLDTSEDKVEEYEPNVDFAPVIPLPELVEVKTGEEGETIVFEERAKILRWAAETKEWKEKGVGNAKLLLDPESGRVRIVMRRDQVHKVCCNHRIDETISIARMSQSPKAATWTAQDFSDGESKSEILCIRFGQVDTLNKFLDTVADLQKKMTDGRVGGAAAGKKAEPAKPAELKPLSEMFKKQPNTWECDSCLVRNENDLNECSCCQAKRPGAPASKPASKPAVAPSTTTTTSGAKPLSEMFKKAPGSWECPGCMVHNTSDVHKCKCCETPQPGYTGPATDEAPKAASGFSFGIPAATKAQGSQFSFGVPAKQPSPTTTPSSGFTFGSAPAAANSYMFGSNAGVNTTAANSGFSFGANPGSNTTTTSSPGFTFGAMASFAATPTSGSVTPAFSLGSTTTKTFAFGSANVTPAKPTNGIGGDLKLGSDKFSFTVKESPLQSNQVSSPAGDNDDEADDLEREDETIVFKPVIPLPEKVKVETGEENEDVAYCHRAKLYRFVDSEWKERGLGDFKILRHKETGKVRLLMRREQVFKICLNHYLTKDMEFLPKDEKSWIWCAPDFAEGAVVQEKFCLRFRDSEIAKAFKAALDTEQNRIVPSPQSNSGEKTERSCSSGNAARSLFPEEEPVAVYEFKSTEDQKAEARRLQLPDNWFRYTEAPPCTGCAGCDDTEDDNAVHLKNESKKFEVTLVKSSDDKKESSPENNSTSSAPVVDTTSDKTETAAKESPSVTKLTQLPKPSETIFGSFKVTPEPEKIVETPKLSLFNNFSFKTAVESPKPDSTSSVFGSASGGIFGAKPATPIFGGQTGEGKPTTPIFGAKVDSSKTDAFKTANPTFGSLATGDSKTDAFKPSTPIFGGQSVENKEGAKTSTPVFGATTAFGNSQGIFGGSAFTGNKDKVSVFGNASGSIFGGSPGLDTNKPVFNASEEFSFASLAAKSSGAFESKGKPGWGTEVKPIFGNIQPKKKDEDGEVDESLGEDEAEHDPQFAPIIDLPDIVEVRSGEEDEERLFCERSKIYRYIPTTKEWKERGIGEMKVLHNPQQGTYRLLMRREQVHKLVCNMRITAETEMKPMPKTVNSWLWGGMNYADEEASQEQLAVKFKTEKQAQDFKKIVDSCVIALRERSTVSDYEYYSVGPNTTGGTSGVEDVSDDGEDEDGDYYEEDDEGQSLVLAKEGVKLSYPSDGPAGFTAQNLDLQVYELSPDGPFRIMLEDSEIQSHSMIDPTNNSAYKLPPTGMVWQAQEWVQADEAIRTIRIDLPTADDAQHLYDTVKAQDLTDEVRHSLSL